MNWAAGPGAPVPLVAPPPPPKRGGCLRWVMGGLISSLLACCCLFGAVAQSVDDPLDWKSAVPVVGGQSLGTALIPQTLAPASARKYAWRQNLASWNLGYGLSRAEHESIEDAFGAMASEWDYQPADGLNFRWVVPSGCEQHEWECVFSQLAVDNADDIEPLTELFRARQRATSMDARQLTELVVSFVQNIRYRLPTEATAAFGLLPPAIVVADGSGDCDSKALLAVVILRQLGVDAQILLASGLGHAALGVALPVKGKKFALGGKKYAFVEVTAPDWALGSMPPEYDVAREWRVVAVTLR